MSLAKTPGASSRLPCTTRCCCPPSPGHTSPKTVLPSTVSSSLPAPAPSPLPPPPQSYKENHPPSSTPTSSVTRFPPVYNQVPPAESHCVEGPTATCPMPPSLSQEHPPHKEGLKPLPPHPYGKGKGALTSLRVHQQKGLQRVTAGGEASPSPSPSARTLEPNPRIHKPSRKLQPQALCIHTLESTASAGEPTAKNKRECGGQRGDGVVQEELGGSRWGSLGRWEVSAAKDAEGGKEKGKKK